jgi:archaellin
MKSRLLFFLVPILALSCTYVLEKKVVNPILPPPPILVKADLNAPNFKDPYLLDWPTEFQFKLLSPSKPVVSSEVILDGTAIPSKYANSAVTFSLNPALIRSGRHTVVITLRLDTQTGSLANKLNAEFYPIEKKFDVIVQSDIPNATLSSGPKIENGYLTTRWIIPNQNLYRIEVNKYKSTGFTTEEFVGQKTFWASSKIVFIDSGYVGGRIRYQIFARNFLNTKSIGNLEVNKSPASFLLVKKQDNVFALTWNASITNANFYITSASGSVSVPLSANKIDLDTLFLGDAKTYQIFVQRNDYPKQAYDSTFFLKSSATLPPFRNIHLVPASNEFVLVESSDVSRGSLIDFSIIARVSNRNSIFNVFSPDQSLISSTRETILLSSGNGNPITVPVNDFSKIKAYRMQVVYPNGNTTFMDATTYSALSDNGFTGVSINYNSSPRPALLDLNLDTEINPFNSILLIDSINSDTPTLSQDGQYYCLNTTKNLYTVVYTNLVGTWTAVGKIPVGKRYFKGKGTNELVNIGSDVQVYNLKSTTDSRGFFIPIRRLSYNNQIPISQINYDYLSEALTLQTIDQFNYSTLKVFDINNFQLKFKAKAYLVPSGNLAKHIYSHNYHFLTSGHAEKLNP